MKRAIYRRKVIRAGRTVDIEYTYPTRFGDLLTRSRRPDSKGTPVEMQNYNREIGIRALGRLINENFVPDDIWLTLHYEKNNRPESTEAADKLFRKFMRLLKAEFDKLGIEFKWVRPKTALGSRGAIHHHVLIPQGVPTRTINRLWREVSKASPDARPPDHTLLYASGEYSSLAAYIYDHYDKNDGSQEKTPFDHAENNVPEDPHARNVKRWSCSRNLRKPKEGPPKIVEKIKWREPPIPANDHYIDIFSIRAGCNPITGRPYLYYRQVYMPPSFTCYDPERRKMLKGKEAVQWYRQRNRKYLSEHWLDLAPDGEVIFKTDKGDRQDE